MAVDDGTYELVGGQYTPHHLEGRTLVTCSVAELLGICQKAVPPHVSHDGLVPPDTTDADVLAIRAYLATSWGQVRQYLSGNLTIGGSLG